MFIVSVKSSKLKEAIAVFAIILFVVIAVLYFIGRGKPLPEKEENSISYRAQTAQDCVSFLSQFGWEVEETPVESKEVTIPDPLDKVYEHYNELQKQQSFDLTAYCGKTVQSLSYRVLNYPGYEENSDAIRANLLLFDGVVIGGDISNITLDGFMQPLDVLEADESLGDQPVLEPIE